MHFRIFQDGTSKYRWRLLTDGNEIVSESAEAYETKHLCVRALALIKADVSQADVFDWSVDPILLIRV
jgi:uncharacterized protein YegP (UPF0339 family)